MFFLCRLGIKVVYDISNPANSRVESAVVRCANCSVPQYYPLDPLKTYTLLMTSYVASGGDAYDMFKNNYISRTVIGK